MSAAGKNSISFRKKDLQEQRSIAVGFKKLQFAHKATAGDTSINLSALVSPPEMSSVGFVNPNASDIVSSQLFFYQKNLTLVSSLRGDLIPYLSYTITSSNTIVFNGFTAADGEIFVGTVDYNAVTGTTIADATFATATGTIIIGATDFNVGQAFQVNQYPTQQVGAVLVFRNGQQQFRCIGNNAANEGNYTEVDNGSGLGQIIRFVTAAPGPTEGDSILVVSNGLVAYAPDNSALQQIETIAGQIDSIIPTVAALAGVDESTFQAAPNNVDLKSFGDLVYKILNAQVPIIQQLTSGGTITVGAVTTAPTKAASPAQDLVQYSRNGDMGYFRYQYQQAGTGTAGSGDYLYSLPAGLSFDATKVQFITSVITTLDSVDTAWGMRGNGVSRETTAGASGSGCFIIPYNATQFRVMFSFYFTSMQPHASAYFPYSEAGMEFGFEFNAPISGWAATQSIRTQLGL